MKESKLNHIFNVSNKEGIRETGGGHGQQGVDFQRYWAIKRMIELEQEGVNDFLILFEAVQDISELNCSESPSEIKVYQVKKKNRNDWGWCKLTGLNKPSSKKQSYSGFEDSPIGKLYDAVLSLEGLNVEGVFVSDQSCDIPLKDSGNVATSNKTSVDLIEDEFKEQISKALEHVYGNEVNSEKIGLVCFDKAGFYADAAHVYLNGLAGDFIRERSPSHAGQASSFVSAVLRVISPLGAKTDKCHSLEEMIKHKSYSKKQFANNLRDLEKIPDVGFVLEMYLAQLHGKECFTDVIDIKVKALEYYRSRLDGTNDKEVECEVDYLLSSYGNIVDVKEFLDHVCASVKSSSLSFNDIKAISIIRAIENAKARV